MAAKLQIPANSPATIHVNVVAPEGYETPEALSERGEWLYNAETDEKNAVARAEYARAVVAFDTYVTHIRKGANLTRTSQALGLRNKDTGKDLRGTSVTRLALLGYAVSHGVTSTKDVRKAINYAMNTRKHSPQAVIGIITAWSENEKRSDRSLCSALTAGPDKTELEMLKATLERVLKGVGNAGTYSVDWDAECETLYTAIVEGVGSIRD